MIRLWRESTKLGRVVFSIAAALFVAQLFFVADYSNDKTVRVEQMAKSHSVHGGIAGREIGCRNQTTQAQSVYPLWIEEFPVFPYTGVVLSKILPGDTWRRWTPWIYHAAIWILLGFFWLRFAFPSERARFLEVVGLYGFLPMVVIHATKLVPDPAVVTVSLGALLLFLHGWFKRSLPFFF